MMKTGRALQRAGRIAFVLLAWCGAFVAARTVAAQTPAPSPQPSATATPAPPAVETGDAPAAPPQSTSPADADLSITATVTARELRFERVPNPTVEFTGKPKRNTVWEADRQNLPPQVRPGETYRDIGIRLRITSVFADIDRIVAEALGEVPASDDAPPPPPAVPSRPQDTTTRPPTDPPSRARPSTVAAATRSRGAARSGGALRKGGRR